MWTGTVVLVGLLQCERSRGLVAQLLLPVAAVRKDRIICGSFSVYSVVYFISRSSRVSLIIKHLTWAMSPNLSC